MNLPYQQIYDCSPDTQFHCDVIRIFVYIEMFIIIAQFIIYTITVYIAIDTPFHFNLRTIGIFILFGYFTLLSGRFITILFELGLIQFNDSTPPNLLIFACALQYYFMCCACAIGFCLSCERFVATIYVDDYEYKKRRIVSLYICVQVFIGSIIGCTIVLIGLLPLYTMVIFGQVLNFLSFTVYLALFYINKQRLAFATSNHTRYSLSFRFQLNENLQVMTLFRNIVILSGTLNSVMGIVLVAQNNPDYDRIRILYLHLTFNILTITYSVCIILILLLSVKQYRQYFFQIPIVYFFVHPIFGKCYASEFRSTKVQKITTSAETETYFTHLASQWEDRCPKGS